MMGSGKSTVGKIVAERLGMKFVDLDSKIEQNAGKPITAIFSEDGETDFRQMESDLLIEMSRTKRTVVACGGGIVVSAQNRMFMRESGTVVFMDVLLDVLAVRLDGVSSRPLLNNPDGNRSSLSSIWQEREGFYRQTADIIVDASLPPQACADAILKELEP